MASYDDTATVSGVVAVVPNGADEVSCKSVKITIPASLDGYNSVDVVRAGKNLLNPSIVYSQTTIYTYDSTTGAVTVNASDTSAWTLKTELPLKRGTYTINNPQGRIQYRLRSENYGIDHNINASSGTITLADDDGIKFKFGLGATYPFTAQYMLEYGSTTSAYEPYIAPTTYTASLGRTIHGGEVDIVNGVGKSTHKIYTAADVTTVYWNNKKAEQVDTNHRATFRIALPSGYITVNNSLCNELSYTNVAGGSGAYKGYQLIATAGIYFCIDLSDIGMENATSSTPDQDFLDAIRNYGDNLKFVVELATPTDFTFTGQEVPTRLGYNAFWSEQGDSEVTYYKDGYGFTSVTINKETPDGEPVEQTAKLHKIVYGGLVDVISGKAEPKNILLSSNTDSASTVVNGVTRSYSLDSQTWTLEGTNTKTDANWLIYNGANYVLSKALVVGDTYTYSHTLSANCYSQFTYKDTNGATRALGYLVGNANKNASVTFTVPSNFVELLRFQIGVVKTATSVSEEAVFQLEKASSKTEYAPYFDPFSFQPISMETDEGENTLYADEGDSAITYRKAVE